MLCCWVDLLEFNRAPNCITLYTFPGYPSLSIVNWPFKKTTFVASFVFNSSLLCRNHWGKLSIPLRWALVRYLLNATDPIAVKSLNTWVGTEISKKGQEAHLNLFRGSQACFCTKSESIQVVSAYSHIVQKQAIKLPFSCSLFFVTTTM